MTIIIYVESWGTSHCCVDARVDCSPRDGLNNLKLLKFERNLREFINKGLAEAAEGEANNG